MGSSPPSSANGQQQNRQSGLPRLHTQNNQSNRFSWAQTPAPAQSQNAQSNRFSWVNTPAQAHPATFDTPEHSRPETIIDESPNVAHEMEAPFPQQPATAYASPPHASYEMAPQTPLSHERKTSYTGHNQAHSISSYHEHPALRAPYADPQAHYNYQQPPTHITSPISTISTSSYTQHQPARHYPQSESASSPPKKEPYGYEYTKPPPIPLDFHAPYAASTPRSNSIPAYTPASPMGPNASTFHLEHHSTHPTPPEPSSSSASKTWHSSTLAPSASCLTSLFCPCIVYGRVQYRLAQRSKKAEPTDLLGYKAVNGSCGLMALACGLQGILATIQRTRVRRAYGIEGDIGGDCIRGCCCCCCAVGLNESEMVGREEERRKGGGANGRAGYVSTGRLTYMPPPR